MRKLFFLLLFVLPGFTSVAQDQTTATNNPYFAIAVLDEQTGRGVPLVELRTISEIRYYTDSNGIVAFFEPGLMDQNVFFYVKSHGYIFSEGAHEYHGTTLSVKSGGAVTLKIKRLNIAERLYRLTGEGIYKDSLLVGKPAPIRQPLLNAQVSGQDSVQMTGYRGKLYWFFGDTNKPSFPLGHFGTSGATSLLPASGGLNPEIGVDLAYFTDASGFSRKMYGPDEPGMKWIDGLMIVPDENKHERLLARCSRMKTLEEPYERTLLLFNDEKESFEPIQRFEKNDLLQHIGSTFRHTIGGQDYYYFATPFPTTRVKADLNSIKDPRAYEGFTCLQAETRYAKADSKLDRSGPNGRLVWGWKSNTSPILFAQQKELIDSGKIKPEECWYKLADAETSKPVVAAVGTVNFNAFRQRWVMIFNQIRGETSMLGEIWYSEAETPEGPWLQAHKIITHDHYSFYNVAHHPQFDQDGGRVIYFEGTYTTMFSGNPVPTPRYEYNQIMYRLDLSDPRLKFPEQK